MADQSATGLLGELLRQSYLTGLPIRPTLTNNELIVEFTEKEFLDATTRDLDPKARQYISIKFTEGKMIIRVRLF